MVVWRCEGGVGLWLAGGARFMRWEVRSGGSYEGLWDLRGKSGFV
jgi:hypothetical protein